ncbi:HEPN domain-containing protein [Candidatus Woesearchaeota archaeon]|nr:HEPN domain-containing protein [Candidatus Woesearchaeota archaeon]
MTHSNNKVEWCLKKAEKELAESDLHRGLIKVRPSETLAQDHVKKAEHNLNAALFFKENNYSDWSGSAFFYCIYHCFLAILIKFGYESRNQECTLALMEMLTEQGLITIDLKYINLLNITKAKEIDQSLIIVREEFQYGTETAYKKMEEFEYFVKICREVIDITTEIIVSSEKEI